MRRRAERDDREARRARTADVLQDVVRGGRQERRVARAGELRTHDRGVDQDAERVAVRGLRLGERRIGHSARHRHLARLADVVTAPPQRLAGDCDLGVVTDLSASVSQPDTER